MAEIKDLLGHGEKSVTDLYVHKNHKKVTQMLKAVIAKLNEDKLEAEKEVL